MSCTEFDRSTSYHSDNQTLRVVVNAKTTALSGCFAKATPIEYRYALKLTGELPERVVVHPSASEESPLVANVTWNST